jgi:Glycosyl hydrolase catalytic core
MKKTLRITIIALLAALALTLLPASASAKVDVRVGIGDQQVSMFDNPLFQARKFKVVRYFVPWNVAQDKRQLALATAYVQRARRDHIQVLLHVSSDDLRIKKAELPSVAQYRTQIKKIVSTFRPLGVRDFGVWNEANHASQPTYRSPTRAAQYFREMYRLVKARCRTCAVVALDVLDQRGVETYMRSFYRALSSTYRKRATLVGIHNYGDVNRKRTTFTRNIIRQSRHYNRSTKFWFTETGGIVKFGRSFPCSTSRAASRINTMFSLAKRYRSSGVQRLYVYNWTGAGCAARFDAGLTGPDGAPRSGYSVLRRQLPRYLR